MSELADILSAVDGKPASYLMAARKLAAHPQDAQLAPLRVFALATFTFDLLHPYFVVEGAKRGLQITVEAGPFGQLEQQVLDRSSALAASPRDVIIVAVRVEDVAAELADGFLAATPAQIDERIAAYVERVTGLCRTLRASSSARVVVWNQPPLQRIVAGLADPTLELSQQHAIADLNRRLAAAASAIPGVTVFDVARLATELGTRNWYDPKLFALSRTPFTAAAQIAIATHLARTLRALVKAPCKCLVLDLDNTLWGGVLGEDGVGGIQLGEAQLGGAYKAFQRVIRSYRDRGVLLAIASKNNASDVDEVFGHADMVLRAQDFAALQIHWNDKASSLRAIAAELNIGVDALAFFDDSAVERAWVREQLPEVTVIEVPADPLRYVDALDASGAFDHLVVTTEDRQRAAQYQSEAGRRELERTAASLDEFLTALQLKVSIGRIDNATIPRVAQLLGKTNQFNVTTRRHTEGDLAGMLARADTIGLWMRVSDRYGDHGLVGVAIAVRDPDGRYRIDSFLMSCRVLGRKVEHALLRSVAVRARAAGADALLGEFIPTKKNAPAAAFFADCGFVAVDGRPGFWRFDLAAIADPASWLEVSEES